MDCVAMQAMAWMGVSGKAIPRWVALVLPMAFVLLQAYQHFWPVISVEAEQQVKVQPWKVVQVSYVESGW